MSESGATNDDLPRLSTLIDPHELESKIFKQPPTLPTGTKKAKTLEEVLVLFGKHKGVEAVMLMDRAGKIIRSSFDGSTTGIYCGISKQILDTMAPTIENTSGNGSPVSLIRINSCTQELIICPVSGEDLVFVIIQNPADRPSVASSTKLPTPRKSKSQHLHMRMSETHN